MTWCEYNFKGPNPVDALVVLLYPPVSSSTGRTCKFLILKKPDGKTRVGESHMNKMRSRGFLVGRSISEHMSSVAMVEMILVHRPVLTVFP